MHDACSGLLYFFASPKKYQKRSPEIDDSPISGSSYVDQWYIVVNYICSLILALYGFEYYSDIQNLIFYFNPCMLSIKKQHSTLNIQNSTSVVHSGELHLFPDLSTPRF